MNLDQTIALVTGGASGLGKGTALRFARNGAKVAIVDLPGSAGAAVTAEIGDNAMFVAADVTSEAEIEAALDAVQGRFGAVNAVINCAGIAIAKRIVSRKGPHPLDAFMRVLQVNVGGTFNVARLAAARMAQAEPNSGGERGVIVCTASVAAYDGQIGQTAYSASKGGIVAMTLPMARDLAGSGIRVVTIAPGIFKTPMLAGLPEAAQASLGQQVPFPSRLGDPDEYGALAQHIVENTMLNGETIRLDGALRMGPK